MEKPTNCPCLFHTPRSRDRVAGYLEDAGVVTVLSNTGSGLTFQSMIATVSHRMARTLFIIVFCFMFFVSLLRACFSTFCCVLVTVQREFPLAYHLQPHDACPHQLVDDADAPLQVWRVSRAMLRAVRKDDVSRCVGSVSCCLAYNQRCSDDRMS